MNGAGSAAVQAVQASGRGPSPMARRLVEPAGRGGALCWGMWRRSSPGPGARSRPEPAQSDRGSLRRRVRESHRLAVRADGGVDVRAWELGLQKDKHDGRAAQRGAIRGPNGMQDIGGRDAPRPARCARASQYQRSHARAIGSRDHAMTLSETKIAIRQRARLTRPAIRSARAGLLS